MGLRHAGQVYSFPRVLKPFPQRAQLRGIVAPTATAEIFTSFITKRCETSPGVLLLITPMAGPLQT